METSNPAIIAPIFHHTPLKTKQDMIASITYSFPDQDFWVEYTDLWENSAYRPAFQSPHYIKYLANKYKEDLAIYQFILNEKLSGTAFFRKDGKEHRLLTDIKADHNFFVLRKTLGQEDIATFFKCFLAEVKKENWGLRLFSQPMWTFYTGTFIKALDKSGLFWNVANHSVCPVLEEQTPKELYDKLNSSRELRYRVNKIKSQLKGEFEIFTGDEDLGEWVTRFCELHTKRWESTNSPSRYHSEEEQAFLKNCLSAWVQDKTLVRFSIKAGGERIAFVICLIQQNTLVHHSTSYDEAFYKYSPGKALILVIADWMQSRGLNVLDFGEGAEPYKYSYTNKELDLNEISVSSFSNFSFILKVKARQILREKISGNPRLIKFYKEKIRPLTQRAKD